MNRNKKVVRMGMDVGKKMFHVFGVDEASLEVVKKKLRRKQVLPYFANLPPCLVAMEACGGSHFRARERGKNKAAVALANKNARIIWALLRRVTSV